MIWKHGSKQQKKIQRDKRGIVGEQESRLDMNEVGDYMRYVVLLHFVHDTNIYCSEKMKIRFKNVKTLQIN